MDGTVRLELWEGYDPEVSVLRGKGKEAAVENMPRVHLVASLLKRWLMRPPSGGGQFSTFRLLFG